MADSTEPDFNSANTRYEFMYTCDIFIYVFIYPDCSCSNLSHKAWSLFVLQVFLSSVHLDCPDVMSKLNTLFTGYSTVPPVAFVLCGPFLSPKVYHDPSAVLTGWLRKEVSSIALSPCALFLFDVRIVFDELCLLYDNAASSCWNQSLGGLSLVYAQCR